jgi:hypothetical protein
MTGTIKQDAEGMADAILASVRNGLAGNSLFDGMEKQNIDEKAAKLRIPYAVYLGED